MTQHEAAPDSGHSQGHPSDGFGPERGEVTQADDSGSHRPPHQTHTYFQLRQARNVLAIDLYE